MPHGFSKQRHSRVVSVSAEPTFEELLARGRAHLRSPEWLRAQLALLDEEELGRRRLASEERKFQRLRRELAAIDHLGDTMTEIADKSVLKEAYDRACDELDAEIDKFEALAGDPNASEADITAVRKAVSAGEEKAANAKKRLELARDRRISVREPDAYGPGNPTFLQDLFAAQVKGEPGAAERIAKHQAFEVEKFAVATSTLGGIIPPQYLVELYAKAQRFGRVFADQVRHEPLPPEGMSLIVPRLTTGLAAGIQASEGATVTTQDPVESDLTVPVRTIAGYSPVSRQTLERSSYSEKILFEDLIARYNAALDTQLLSGSGSSGQHQGVIGTSGVSTATVSSWSAANAWAALAGETGVIAQINQWAATAGSIADKAFMHPRRWGAFLGLLDSQNRPLFGIGGEDNYAPMGEGDAAGYGRVGKMLGLDIYVDANIPTNLGGGTNQDDIIVVASPAVILWEDEDGPITLAFEQQAGTSLTVELVCLGYSAFTAGRYPAATGIISGAGLT